MQTVYVETNKSNPLDILAYYEFDRETKTDLYKLLPMPLDNTKFVIQSMHKLDLPALTPADHKKIHIGVISYVPTLTSSEWPMFYLNLCFANIIACDSYVLKQLESVARPDKPVILLDGINPLFTRNVDLSVDDTRDIPVYVHSENKDLVDRFSIQLNADKGTDNNSLNFVVERDMRKAIAFLSFETLGQALANTLSANYRIWIPYEKTSALFLDTRLTHNFQKDLMRMSEIAGSVQSQMAASLFRRITAELSDIIVHAAVSDVPEFRSTQTLVTRIMNEVNRAH